MSEDLPLFVSFPRSGSHWIQAVLELYFDKPRAPSQHRGISWRPRKHNEPYMWTHTHDMGLNTEPNNELGAIFLYRDPVDAIYSRLVCTGFIIPAKAVRLSEGSVHAQAKFFRTLFRRWHTEGRARTCIAYEDIIEDPMGVVKIVSDHFGHKWDPERAQEALDCCSKEAVLTKNKGRSKFHNKNMLSEDYACKREQFRELWTEFILDKVINPENAPYLNRYRENLDK